MADERIKKAIDELQEKVFMPVFREKMASYGFELNDEQLKAAAEVGVLLTAALGEAESEIAEDPIVAGADAIKAAMAISEGLIDSPKEEIEIPDVEEVKKALEQLKE